MSRRTRAFAFGLAAGLVIAGGACAALLGGVAGEVLTIVLISAGLGGALLLLFLEIGLGEERELARDQQRSRKRAHRLEARRRGGVRRWRRRPD